jgi:putative sigma-54 modulation protein
MQAANANPPVSVTGRHVAVTAAINDYAQKKIESLHLDYPRIIDAHVILDVEKYRHRAEIVLTCSNHISIEASEQCDDLYAAIDQTVGKIARQMRKHKTRLLRSHRPRLNDNVRYVREQVFSADALNMPDSEFEALVSTSTQKGLRGNNGQHPEPAAPALATTPAAGAMPAAAAPARPVIQTERHPLKPMFVDEAILQMEIATRDFLVFLNAASEKVNVLYRRKSGDFGLIQPESA